MKTELDKALCEKYPKIFADRNGDVTETCMAWGFECGDGWYTLIDTLCAAIQNTIDHRNKEIQRCTMLNDLVYEYAHGNREPLQEFAGEHVKLYVKRGIEEVPLAIPQVVASQVKEKYGGLRFYYSGGDDGIDTMVSFAEMLSERTCETCGAPGKVRGGLWYYTACDAHTKEEDLHA